MSQTVLEHRSSTPKQASWHRDSLNEREELPWTRNGGHISTQQHIGHNLRLMIELVPGRTGDPGAARGNLAGKLSLVANKPGPTYLPYRSTMTRTSPTTALAIFFSSVRSSASRYLSHVSRPSLAWMLRVS